MIPGANRKALYPHLMLPDRPALLDVSNPSERPLMGISKRRQERFYEQMVPVQQGHQSA